MARVRALRWTIALCAGLLITFATLGWSAVAGKSPTADEGYHAMAGWLHLWKGEYRFDSEDPPLWNTLAAATTGPHSIHVDSHELEWSDLPMNAGAEYKWQVQTLFRTPGNDPTAFIRRFRAAMLAVGVALLGLLAWFVWRVARSCGATPFAAGAATVGAVGLLALDPNFLAHSPLMKNDVASAFVLLGLTASTWAAGRALTRGRGLALGIWSGIAMTVKFNGPLLIASVAALLFLRAISPWPWPVSLGRSSGRLCVSRISRIAAAAVMLAFMGIMSFAMIWFSYGLRFAPSAEPGATMDISGMVSACMADLWADQHLSGVMADAPTKWEILAMPRPMVVRLSIWANDRHVLPQAFVAGILYVFKSTLGRGTFLWGRLSNSGTWWYFPFAIAVKTPVATLIAFAAALIIFTFHLARPERESSASFAELPIGPWTALCLCVPPLIYLGAAMSSNLNLGIRHVLPVYPLLFAAAGLALARLWDWHQTTALVTGLFVIAALALESCSAFPNYIPFFNVLAGGNRGGLRLLSDSNLDWGQDLPLLAQWQRSHPDQKLYLSYFGAADPEYYGIRYTNVQDNYFTDKPVQPITLPGVLAISATTLQGTYSQQPWSELWELKPFDVLGGSIYLFHVPPAETDRLPSGSKLID